jgi:hypothetical protein
VVERSRLNKNISGSGVRGNNNSIVSRVQRQKFSRERQASKERARKCLDLRRREGSSFQAAPPVIKRQVLLCLAVQLCEAKDWSGDQVTAIEIEIHLKLRSRAKFVIDSGFSEASWESISRQIIDAVRASM